jgi:hypothetical protein
MKNFNGTIGNRTSDFPVCSAVSQVVVVVEILVVVLVKLVLIIIIIIIEVVVVVVVCIQRIPYQGVCWKFWWLRKRKASNSQCEI